VEVFVSSTPSEPAAPSPPHAYRRRRRPRWLLRVAGVSAGGLAVGVAIGLILPN
jgi:hypothetical protein